MIKHLLLLLLVLALWSCSKQRPLRKGIFVPLEETVLVSPLDSILGEKVLNVQTGEIRPDNFDNFIGLSTGVLRIKSDVYTVDTIDENHFLLRQDKSYEHARHCNIVLKAENEIVIDYFVSNDFSIKDIKRSSDGWLMLTGDFDNHNHYWVSNAEISVISLNADFDTLWSYNASNSNHPLNALQILSREDRIVLSVEVITGSHMCYSIVELELDTLGKFQSVKEVSLMNVEGMSVRELEAIFDPVPVTLP